MQCFKNSEFAESSCDVLSNVEFLSLWKRPVLGEAGVAPGTRLRPDCSFLGVYI